MHQSRGGVRGAVASLVLIASASVANAAPLALSKLGLTIEAEPGWTLSESPYANVDMVRLRPGHSAFVSTNDATSCPASDPAVPMSCPAGFSCGRGKLGDSDIVQVCAVAGGGLLIGSTLVSTVSDPTLAAEFVQFVTRTRDALILRSGSSSAAAKGRSRRNDAYYDVGIQSIQGLTFAGVAASGMGLHVTEHDGLITRLPLLVSQAEVTRPSDTKTVVVDKKVTTVVDEYGDEIGELTEWTTVTVEKTNVEKEIDRARAKAQAKALSAKVRFLASISGHCELLYLPNRDDQHLRGVRGSWYPMAAPIGRRVELSLGYAGARLEADVDDATTGMTRTAVHRSQAVGVRLGVTPVRWLALVAELHVNILGFTHDDVRADYGSTARGSATLVIPKVERVFGRLGAERIGLGAGGAWSTFLEAGVRF